ncbi:hypothetical protein CDAR_190341 [Caerostris darwini]|uniref:Uncharacterized protein n=1 Tax=Caerostris darwini TaxID=1538125 RepID=A0AAV4MND9_9ARAC|nr:hypothetical protein CDAR_190341 [Caerostris darwini]
MEMFTGSHFPPNMFLRNDPPILQYQIKADCPEQNPDFLTSETENKHLNAHPDDSNLPGHKTTKTKVISDYHNRRKPFSSSFWMMTRTVPT